MPTNYDMGPDEGGAVQSSPKQLPKKKSTTESIDSSRDYSSSSGLGSIIFPTDLEIFLPSLVHQPCAKTRL